MRGCLLLILGLLFPALQFLIIQKCIAVLLGPGNRKVLGYAAWFLYYVFLVIAGFGSVFSPQFLLGVNILMIFIIGALTRKESLKKCCICALFLCTVWMLVEFIVLFILKMLGTDESVFNEMGSFLSKMCMLLFSVLLVRYAGKKRYPDLLLPYFIMMLSIPVGSIYIMHHIFLMTADQKEYVFFSMLAGILLLFMNYVIFMVYDRIGQAGELQAQNRLYEQQLELCSRHAKEQETSYMELRRMRHDMKNHLSGILGMVTTGKTQETAEYIQKMLDDGISRNTDEVIHSGNIVVDSLINYKYSLAIKDSIRFEALVFIPPVLPFQSGHLTVILGNLLENALEACRKVVPEKRYIIVELTYVKEMLQICVRNSCLNEEKKDRLGHYLTTKKEKEYHGIGLASVKQALNDYNGELLINHAGDDFRVSAVLYANSIEEK